MNGVWKAWCCEKDEKDERDGARVVGDKAGSSSGRRTRGLRARPIWRTCRSGTPRDGSADRGPALTEHQSCRVSLSSMRPSKDRHRHAFQS
nr:hypothetical protein CFP56_03020 [Quercus suber]